MCLSFSRSLVQWAVTLTCLLAFPLLSIAHPELLSQIEQLSLQLEQRPGDAALLIKRGDLYRRDGDYLAAGHDFAKAANAKPPPADLAFFEGKLYLETGQPDAALASFSHYLVDHPRHVKAWVLRSRALLLLGRPVEAAEDLGRAIELAENPSPGLYRDQALALIKAGEKHWSGAGSVIRAGLGEFTMEISLLGLGTDLALAQDDTASARVFINELPAAVQQLPQWQKRTDLAAGLDGSSGQSREALLLEARGNLLVQVG